MLELEFSPGIYRLLEHKIPSINQIIDHAILGEKLTSDRDLARRLDVAPSMVNNWRKGKNHPSDTSIVKLADLARMDAGQALMALNYWRSPKSVRPEYMSLYLDLFENNSTTKDREDLNDCIL